MRQIVLGAVMLLGVTGLVQAQPQAQSRTPDFDTQAYCRRTVTTPGPFSQDKFDYCLQTEQAARRELGRFAGLPQDKMQRCVHVASAAGSPRLGSYGALVTCLEGDPGTAGADRKTLLP